MQLISEAETNLEIKSNMCDLDQGLCEKEIFKDSQNILRSEDNSNSNKENINIQDNCAEESISLSNEKVSSELSQGELNETSINELEDIDTQDKPTLDIEQNNFKQDIEKNNDDLEFLGQESRLNCNEESEKYTNKDTDSKKDFELQNVAESNTNGTSECVEDSSLFTSLVDQEVNSAWKDIKDIKILETGEQNEDSIENEPEENSKLDICNESEKLLEDTKINNTFEDDITSKDQVTDEREGIQQEFKEKSPGENDKGSEDLHQELDENEICNTSNITSEEPFDNYSKGITQELQENNSPCVDTISQKEIPNNESEKLKENESSSNLITPNDQLCSEEGGINPIKEKSFSPNQDDSVELEDQTCKDGDLLEYKKDTNNKFETTDESGVKKHKPFNRETQNVVVTLGLDSAAESIAPTEENSNKEETIDIVVDRDIKEVSDSTVVDTQNVPTENKAEPMEVDSDTVVEMSIDEVPELKQETVNNLKPKQNLNNTLNILSDDEEDCLEQKASNIIANSTEKQCINIDDDDDIMLIDEEINKETKTEVVEHKTSDDVSNFKESYDKDVEKVPNEESVQTEVAMEEEKNVIEEPTISEKSEVQDTKLDSKKPFLPENFLNIAKKKFSDMTRAEMEEFCVLKIVESIVDRSSLNDLRSKLKNVISNMEDYKKKVTMLTRQNRDLQVVLKSIQEEQKRSNTPIAPLKITRSVGMQVYMADGPNRRKALQMNPATLSANRLPRTPVKQQTPQKTPPANVQQIPVPRLVPASNIAKPPIANVSNSANPSGKASPNQTVVRSSNVQKQAEKRPLNKVQTVDLTDDEPPAKVATKNSTLSPVRVVPQHNLLGTRPQFAPSIGPRKVFIPINGPQAQTIKPGQTIVYKSIPGVRPRAQAVAQPMMRLQNNQMRMRIQGLKHPAPLPDVPKQSHSPNWKALPPAPDLKLSKVENGIVISWKIDNYVEENYEEIASYQLYAYQENASPPNSSLWKKIGDVKALPLPMACTLTQFMAGFKYYFAVRAVDVKSRFGPFSIPGSILLLNKM